MKKTELSPRLAALSNLVPPGARLIDVGTDHAYLPVYLVQQKIVSRALATDIAAGPIARARAHIARAELEDLIETRQTPGLRGVEDFRPDCVVIAGMGGELIASILDGFAPARDQKIAFILQPMTKQEFLRAYLAQNGFEPDEELLVKEDGRIYQAMRVCYTGRRSIPTPLEALVGRKNLQRGGEDLLRLLARKKAQLKKKIEGKSKGNGDISGDLALLCAIDGYLKEGKDGWKNDGQ